YKVIILINNELNYRTPLKDNLTQKEKKYDDKTKTDYFVTAHIARTRVFLKASIQTTDLATGRIFNAQVMEYSPEKENKSYEGKPEAPAGFDVQEIAFNDLVADASHMFLPWSSWSTLYYFDDKDCGLKKAYQALKSGNQELAFNLSVQNLETCRKTTGLKDKILAHAYYNLGMSYLIRNDYDNAILNLEEAQKLRPGDIVKNAISDCNKAKTLAAEMQTIDEKAAVEAEKVQHESQNAVQAQLSATLTNEDIILMTKNKLSDSIIIQKIRSTECKFDTSTDALVHLTESGVSENVILTMIAKK
ncbi:MAG: tetratricopeptide repeat protein, partial [Bacteroidota bacterium]